MSHDRLGRIQAQFTRTADVYARMRQATDERTLEALVAICEPPKGARALDVACGPGFLTFALGGRCALATGVDATQAFIDLARAEAETRGLPNVRFEQGDAEALPFDAASFDLVTCRAAFHHFPAPQKVLSEMARVTVRGGRILVADLLGSEDPDEAAFHDQIERLCDPTHERALAPSTFARLFADTGLTPVREIRSSIDYDLEEWITHGAPEPSARQEIIGLMERCLEEDKSGLDVRREDCQLCFSHRTAAFFLEHADQSPASS